MPRSDIAAVLARLKKIENDGHGLSDRTEIDTWRERARLAVGAAYGEDSSQLKRFDKIRYSLMVASDRTPQSAFDQAYRSGFEKSLRMIHVLIEDIESGMDASVELRPVEIGGIDVFVVHGHDEALKSRVARLLEKLKLNPIILHEQPNGGRTVIEKFEAHAMRAGFAIALLTADDLGRKRATSVDSDRARQNVVLELGYFIGALGRDRTVALIDEGVERPSDLAGLVYVPTTPGWELSVARELKGAGLPVDLNHLA